jgi:hypothetical protein
MWRLNPDADLVAFTKALRRAAGSIHRKIVLEDNHALGPDPHGAPVRRARRRNHSTRIDLDVRCLPYRRNESPVS